VLCADETDRPSRIVLELQTRGKATHECRVGQEECMGMVTMTLRLSIYVTGNQDSFLSCVVGSSDLPRCATKLDSITTDDSRGMPWCHSTAVLDYGVTQQHYRYLFVYFVRLLLCCQFAVVPDMVLEYLPF
jgi:hypothetical protein